MFDGVREAIDEVIEGLDGLVALGPDDLSPLLLEFQREHARLEAIGAVLTGEWKQSGAWRLDGARTPTAWLAGKCRLPHDVAARFIRLARNCRAMPVTAQAWLAGDISAAHVTLLRRADTPRTRYQFAVDEAMLVHSAKTKSFIEAQLDVDRWIREHDQDGAEDDAARRHAKRGFDLADSFQGMGFGRVTFDPLNLAAFRSVFDPLVDDEFRKDWDEAKERLGHKPTINDLRRTPTQRRLDALVEMARRAGTAPIDGRRPAPLFTALVGLGTLKHTAELANGTPVTAGALVPWLTDAYVERVVFESPSRVIDVGRPQRFFRGALRRAIEVRDRRCFHELCEIPADRCHVDHIIPAEADGPTTQGNGRLACDFHNWDRQRHPPQRPPP